MFLHTAKKLAHVKRFEYLLGRERRRFSDSVSVVAALAVPDAVRGEPQRISVVTAACRRHLVLTRRHSLSGSGRLVGAVRAVVVPVPVVRIAAGGQGSALGVVVAAGSRLGRGRRPDSGRRLVGSRVSVVAIPFVAGVSGARPGAPR